METYMMDILLSSLFYGILIEKAQTHFSQKALIIFGKEVYLSITNKLKLLCSIYLHCYHIAPLVSFKVIYNLKSHKKWFSFDFHSKKPNQNRIILLHSKLMINFYRKLDNDILWFDISVSNFKLMKILESIYCLLNIS